MKIRGSPGFHKKQAVGLFLGANGECRTWLKECKSSGRQRWLSEPKSQASWKLFIESFPSISSVCLCSKTDNIIPCHKNGQNCISKYMMLWGCSCNLITCLGGCTHGLDSVLAAVVLKEQRGDWGTGKKTKPEWREKKTVGVIQLLCRHYSQFQEHFCNNLSSTQLSVMGSHTLAQCFCSMDRVTLLPKGT